MLESCDREQKYRDQVEGLQVYTYILELVIMQICVSYNCLNECV